MPRINPITGAVVMGVGDGLVSIDGVVIARGGCASWLTSTTILYSTTNNGVDWRLETYDTGSGVKVPVHGSTGANELAAGGGRWAAYQTGRGVYGDISITAAGLSHADADARGGAGDDGTLAIVPVRQTGLGLELHSTAGLIVAAPSGTIAQHVHVLGPGRALWRDPNGRLGVLGLSLPVQAGAAYGPRWVDVPGQVPWIVYWTPVHGLIAHPVDGLVGVVIATGDQAFYHDARLLDGQLRVAYSLGQGELLADLQVVADAFALRRVDFGAAPPVEIPIIGKNCWCGWFEFTGPPPAQPPGHAVVAIRYPAEHDTIKTFDGRQFAQWVDGGDHPTVELIEAEAAGASYPPVVYWDGRHWPRWPSLPPGAWLGFQWYCSKGETPAAFEADVRRTLDTVPPEYAQIAGICQAYTQVPVNKLTDAPDQLVPVFARLARDYPRVTMLLAFSDAGRDGGMTGGPTVSHPELRPLWDRLVAGIPGTPETGGPVPNCGEPGHVPDWDHRMPNRVDVVQRFKDQYPDEWVAMNTQGDTTLIKRIAYALHTEDDPRWGLNGKRGTDILSEDVIAFLNETVQNNGRPGMEAADVVISHGSPAASPGWIDITCSTTQGGAGGKWIQPQAVDPPDPPEPGALNVLILSFDPVVRRSDPNGLLVRFEVEADRPVVRVELDLEGDGEPSIPIAFLNEPRRDGRYVRALAWKPTVNGRWTLRVSAWDDQNQTAQSDGSHIVEVTP